MTFGIGLISVPNSCSILCKANLQNRGQDGRRVMIEWKLFEERVFDCLPVIVGDEIDGNAQVTEAA